MKKALKVPFYITFAFLLAIFAVAYLYFFTTLPEREINNWIDFRALRRSGYNVSFERINRDIWDHVTVEGIVITPRNPGAGPSFSINRADFRYSVARLAKGDYAFDSINLDSASATIPPSTGAKKPSSVPRRFSLPISVSAKEVRINSIVAELPNGETVYSDSVAFSVDVHGDSMGVTLEKLALRWPERDFQIKEFTGRIFNTDTGFHLEGGRLVTGRSRLSIEGEMGQSLFNGLAMQIHCEPVDLTDISILTGAKINGRLDASLFVLGELSDFSGRATVNGLFMERPFENVAFSYRLKNKVLTLDSIDGKVFKASFKGDGEIDFGVKPEQYKYEGTVAHLNLQEISPDLKTDFTGKVILSGQGFGGNDFTMQANCDLDSVRIEDYFFDEASGTVTFNLERIKFSPGFKARYKHTRVTADGSLEYAGNIDISGAARFDDLTDFTNQIFIKKLGGSGDAVFDVSGPTRDFSIRGTYDSDSSWVYGLYPGKIHVDADLKSFLSHRVGTVDCRWDGGELYSVPTDSGFIGSSLSGDLAFIDSARVFGLQGGVWLNGVYDGTQIPPVFLADTLQGDIFGNEFSSIEPIAVDIYDGETAIESLKLKYGTGIIELDGIVTDSLDLDLDLKITGLQINSILGQLYPEKDIMGIWSGGALITGNFENPSIKFDVDLDSLTVDKIQLGRLASEAVYHDGYLRTDSTSLISAYGEYRFSGYLPMNLSFGEVDERFPQKPIDLRLVTKGRRFLLAEIFISAVERYDTDFEFEFNLTGTYDHPTVSGTGQLSNGTLKLQYAVNPVIDLNAWIRMENEKIFIDSVSATVERIKREYRLSDIFSGSNGMKEKPSIRASGSITLLGLNNFLYDLAVKGRNVYFVADAYDVSGVAGFDLKVQGETPPVVRGDVSFLRLDIRDEFENFVGPDYDPTAAAVEDSTIWDLDLNLSAPNNIWIKNRDIDAEFKADIHVQRHVGILAFLGTLNVIRGSYDVLGQKFTFNSGTLTYTDFASVDPEIDFQVSTRVRNYQKDGQSRTAVPLTLDLHITGTLLKPEINASGLSNEEALRLLLEGNWAGGAISTGGSQDVLTSVSAVAASMGIDPSTAQGLLDEVEIGEFEAGKGARISLAKYVSPNLFIRYSTRLRDPESNIEVEYYFNDKVSFRATQGLKGSQNEGISFDINFGYEY